MTFSGGSSFTIDAAGASGGTISATGGGAITISAPTIITGAVKGLGFMSTSGSSGQILKTNGSGILTYGDNKSSYPMLQLVPLQASTVATGNTSFYARNG